MNPTSIYIHDDKITLINIEAQKKPHWNKEQAKYVAPELLEEGDFDEKIDVWSLGVISWRIIFNKYPFEIHGPTTKLDT